MNQTDPSKKKEIWKSPIGAEAIVSGSIKLSESRFGFERGDSESASIYWIETRPLEGGRNVVVRKQDQATIDMFPPSFNARSLVHEYGGGSYVILANHDDFAEEIIAFVNYKDQRIYLSAKDKEPRVLTCEGPFRYADLVHDKKRNRIICVMEIFPEKGGEPQNVLASISLKLDGAEACNKPEILYQGHDFFAFPCLSADGALFAFIAWEHPHMPWDESRLYLVDLNNEKTEPVVIAGGANNSVYQPLFAPDGTLFFVDEETGFWNIYRIANPAACLTSSSVPKSPVILKSAEFGLPLWVFADPTFALAEDGKSLYSAYCQKGFWHLALLEFNAERNDYSLRKIETPFTDMDYVSSFKSNLVMIAGAPNMVRSVVKFDTVKNSYEILRAGSVLQIEEGFISIPQAIEFEGANKELAHAFFYPPCNKDVDVANKLDKQPLIVRSHGGPTSASDAVLNLTYQFWTSRGFGVVDVNYGGSTGFGRKYRNRLLKNWGVVDMLDCRAAAQYLSDKGLADSERLIIAGGSAGGYTTLCALTFTDTFTAGCSYYGIGDLKALMNDTHKFESRYLDSLIGPYPDCAELYFERSPINFTDKLSCPVIFFQGLEDKVVPPSQTEQMVDALRRKKLTVAYLAYEGEQHGFRKAENIKRTLEGELYFYSLIFGLTLQEKIEPISVNF